MYNQRYHRTTKKHMRGKILKSYIVRPRLGMGFGGMERGGVISMTLCVCWLLLPVRKLD